ncbi:hypothetical protein N5D99_07030 [Aeromonas caviae]|uniref:hypothetical protein n=1 Tax=Aeromonas caviae TaxID=648 RepID=UPI00244CEBED|nr:hypothetical protein [Aeromonas caviae]MDH1844650.1 hypothetical protein [Aeromonas caviae]
MAGVWKRDGTVAVTNGNKKVTGTGTTFADTKNGVAKGHLFCITSGTSVDFYEVDYAVSNTELYLVQAYRGVTATGKAYEIITTFSDSVPEFARRLTATLSAYQQQSDAFQALLTSTATTVEVTAPDGTKQTLIPWKRVTSEGEGQTARAKVEADRAKTEADRAAAAANATAEAGTGSLMRVGGATILDAERYALERATGGRQTIIRDSAGNANAMFVLPRFSYADLGMTADMGTGDVTAFDVGTGSIKGEIFIGAYLASGSGAVSAPRQDPRTSLDHTAARNACSAKGAGWHLMTAHEWAAIALWCMANGYEPIGNTNWGRSHAKTWMVGDRADNRAPGDTAGTGRTQTGSMGSEATHTRTLGGIADLVGNVWEWQDGFLLQDGRFKISAYNTQAEVDWAFVDAYLDASSLSGGSAILSSAITNRIGPLGDNANTGNSASVDWRSMTKAGGYVSLQALRRLLVEPASVLPQGRIYMRNFGERLPYRGGSWSDGAYAGLAALSLPYSRANANTLIGFRPAFA